MSISNYGELKTAVLDWANRGSSWPGSARISDFVGRAHDRINRMLRTQESEKRAYTDTVADQDYYPLPADMLEIRDIVLQTTPIVRLIKTTPSEMNRIYVTRWVQIPRHYTVVADQFRVAPVPSGVFRLEIVYYYSLPAFSLDTDTNWVLQKHPFLYLHGALAELYRYSKDTEGMADSESQFMAIGAEIELLDNQKAFSGNRTESPYMEVFSAG